MPSTWNIAVLLGALCVSLMTAGCAMPIPAASRSQIRAIERASITTPSGDLSYLRAGDPARPRIIYIHGTPGNGYAWADFLVEPVADAAGPYEAIAIDRPGFGHSGKKAVVSFKDQADAIVPLLVEREGQWPILVGHSLGGPIIARLAADHPDKVRALIIVGGSLDPALENPSLLQRTAQTSLMRFFMPLALDNSLQELKAARAQTEELAPTLAAVRCPVIIIHGTKDKLVPYANVVYMQRTLTHAASIEIITLDRKGHFTPWEDQDVIRSAVQELAKPQ